MDSWISIDLFKFFSLLISANWGNLIITNPSCAKHENSRFAKMTHILSWWVFVDLHLKLVNCRKSSCSRNNWHKQGYAHWWDIWTSVCVYRHIHWVDLNFLWSFCEYFFYHFTYKMHSLFRYPHNSMQNLAFKLTVPGLCCYWYHWLTVWEPDWGICLWPSVGVLTVI